MNKKTKTPIEETADTMPFEVEALAAFGRAIKKIASEVMAKNIQTIKHQRLFIGLVYVMLTIWMAASVVATVSNVIGMVAGFINIFFLAVLLIILCVIDHKLQKKQSFLEDLLPKMPQSETACDCPDCEQEGKAAGREGEDKADEDTPTKVPYFYTFTYTRKGRRHFGNGTFDALPGKMDLEQIMNFEQEIKNHDKGIKTVSILSFSRLPLE